jgi:hypothetical protein
MSTAEIGGLASSIVLVLLLGAIVGVAYLKKRKGESSDDLGVHGTPIPRAGGFDGVFLGDGGRKQRHTSKRRLSAGYADVLGHGGPGLDDGEVYDAVQRPGADGDGETYANNGKSRGGEATYGLGKGPRGGGEEDEDEDVYGLANHGDRGRSGGMGDELDLDMDQPRGDAVYGLEARGGGSRTSQTYANSGQLRRSRPNAGSRGGSDEPRRKTLWHSGSNGDGDGIYGRGGSVVGSRGGQSEGVYGRGQSIRGGGGGGRSGDDDDDDDGGLYGLARPVSGGVYENNGTLRRSRGGGRGRSRSRSRGGSGSGSTYANSGGMAKGRRATPADTMDLYKMAGATDETSFGMGHSHGNGGSVRSDTYENGRGVRGDDDPVYGLGKAHMSELAAELSDDEQAAFESLARAVAAQARPPDRRAGHSDGSSSGSVGGGVAPSPRLARSGSIKSFTEPTPMASGPRASVRHMLASNGGDLDDAGPGYYLAGGTGPQPEDEEDDEEETEGDFIGGGGRPTPEGYLDMVAPPPAAAAAASPPLGRTPLPTPRKLAPLLAPGASPLPGRHSERRTSNTKVGSNGALVTSDTVTSQHGAVTTVTML